MKCDKCENELSPKELKKQAISLLDSQSRVLTLLKEWGYI